jgi:hypothetical protein
MPNRKIAVGITVDDVASLDYFKGNRVPISSGVLGLTDGQN